MADIHQWRRKIYPRSKTPTLEREERNHNSSVTTSASSTPSRRSRTNFSSLLSHNHGLPQSASVASLLSPSKTVQLALPKPYCPDVFLMAQVIMTKLLSNTHEGLGPNYNGQVMHIIEAYRNLAMEQEPLLAKLKDMEAALARTKSQLQDCITTMDSERKIYQEDNKRLRQSLAHATPGLVDRREKQTYNPLRRTTAPASDAGTQTQMTQEMCEIPHLSKENEKKNSLFIYASDDSPSSKAMRTLSQTLAQPSSSLMPSKRQGPTSPTLTRFQSPRPSPSRLQRHRRDTTASIYSVVGQSEAHLSEDNYSTFSSNGDAFTDEFSDGSGTTNIAADKDFGAVRRLAEVMACRHGTNLDDALTKLADIFFAPECMVSRASSAKNPTMHHHPDRSDVRPSSSAASFPPGSADSHVPVVLKAPAHAPPPVPFSRVVTNQQRLYRPFSFYIGDDRDVDIFSRPYVDRPDPPVLASEEFNVTGQESAPQSPALPNQHTIASSASEMPLISSPVPTYRKSSTSSQIPLRNSTSIFRDSTHRLRENSTSSIGTVVHRPSPTSAIENHTIHRPGPSSRSNSSNSRPPSVSRGSNTSRPGSVRTSSLQNIMSGLRGNRYRVSAASLGTSSNSSGQRRVRDGVSDGDGLTEDDKVTAVAAARAAGERGGNQI